MKKLVLLLPLALSACFTTTPNPGPATFTSLEPRFAPAGSDVLVNGTNLDKTTKVLINNEEITILSKTPSQLKIKTPSLEAGSYQLELVENQVYAKPFLEILADTSAYIPNQAVVVFRNPQTEQTARKIALDNQMTMVKFAPPTSTTGICSKGMAVYERQGGTGKAIQTADDIPEVLEANPHTIGTGAAYSDSGPTDNTQHKNEFFTLQINSAYTYWKSQIPTLPKRNPRVAVLDTGVSPHYEFRNLFNFTQSNLLTGKNFTTESSGTAVALELDTADLAENASGLRVGHGTAIAAIIGARDTEPNTNFPGVFWQVGVLPAEDVLASGAEILPVKVCDKTNKCLGINVLEGLCYAINQKADVINLSLSGVQPASILKTVLEEASAAGIVTVASAGNRGTAPHYPAAYSRSLPIIAVGSVEYNAATSNYIPSSFSVPGDWISIAAPGKTMSASFDSSSATGFGYRQFEGTSFAAAWVSGVAAMQKGLDPSKSPLEIRTSITSTATLFSACTLDKCGAGMVNAARAIGAP